MPENTWLAVVLVIGLVVLVNLGLWFMWRNRGIHDQIKIVRRAGKTLRRPWHQEDADLEELSQRVSALRKEQEGGGRK